MYLKLSILVLGIILFVFHTNGFRLTDFSSSEEADFFTDDDDDSSSIEEADYWNLLNDLKTLVHEPHSHISNISSSEDIRSIIEDFVDAKVEAISQLRQSSNVRGKIRYTIGKRVRGDKIVSFTSRNQSWSVYQNVKSNISYPTKGVGRKLTYVEIRVNQTTNLGQAYIVRGGIRKRFITIIIEAYQTLFFNFNAKFYEIIKENQGGKQDVCLR